MSWGVSASGTRAEVLAKLEKQAGTLPKLANLDEEGLKESALSLIDNAVLCQPEEALLSVSAWGSCTTENGKAVQSIGISLAGRFPRKP